MELLTGSGTELGDKNRAEEEAVGDDALDAGSDNDGPGVGPEEVPEPPGEAAGAGDGETGIGPGHAGQFDRYIGGPSEPPILVNGHIPCGPP